MLSPRRVRMLIGAMPAESATRQAFTRLQDKATAESAVAKLKAMRARRAVSGG